MLQIDSNDSENFLFFLSAKIFVIEQKDCTCAIDFFICQLIIRAYFLCFDGFLTWFETKLASKKDSRYLVKLTKSQKVLFIGSHLQKNTLDHSFTGKSFSEAHQPTNNVTKHCSLNY